MPKSLKKPRSAIIRTRKLLRFKWDFQSGKSLSKSPESQPDWNNLLNNLIGTRSNNFTKLGMCDPSLLKLRQGKSPSSSQIQQPSGSRTDQRLKRFSAQRKETQLCLSGLEIPATNA